ncbi:TonB-dependent receptor [Caulobacter sp. CCUG 60055]|nr:TonB-dependent receptor [Caulobacter sp. CCUG 60055]MBQ1542750.1 TonB-dependent receptor [Caulobacteraceae bacterium]MCI3179547.1 TonB-dependent receptor [Caulobacter sp. CCUG 60055]
MFSVKRARLSLLLSAGACLASFAQAYAADGAAASASDASTLETIVVTAQRRVESAQAVPISISSVSGKALESSNFQSVTDLQYLVPGVQYDPTNGSAFQIRGVGSTSFDFSNAKSVSLVVDDVVMDGQRENGLTGLSDIQQVDVLMGPQGTLFGKNATSGVIAITTAKPVLDEWSGKVAVSYGEREDHNLNALANIPLGDKAALRVSAFQQGQEGYGRYTTLRQNLGTFREDGYRAKLLFKPFDGLEAVYAFDREHHWDNTIRTAVSGAPPAVTALQIANGVTPGPKNADNADSSRGMIETTSLGHSLRVQWSAPYGTLTSITAYRETSYDNDTPADLVPTTQFAYIPYNSGRLETSKFSQELRWASPSGGTFEYLGGLFYNRLAADQTQLQWATLGAPLVSPTGARLTNFYALTGAVGVPGNATLFRARNTTTAAFGQLKFNLTSKLSLAVSARYTADRNGQSQDFITIDPLPITGVNATFTATSPPPFLSYGQVKGDNVSYRIAAQYKLTPDAMLYATYSTGYKPAGVAFVGNKYDPYKAETVESYEAGVKSELFGRRLRLNFDVFNSDFTDFQTTILTYIPGSVIAQLVIGNAGGLRTRGAETSLAWKATDAITLTGAVTYADSHFTDYVYNATTNYTGTRLTNAPRWSAQAGLAYDDTLWRGVRVRGSLDYAYRSTTWTVVGQPAYSEVPGYGLLNGRLSLTPPGRDIEFGLYGRNLLNTYYSTGYQQYGALGLLHYTSLNARRTVGVFARFAF